MSNEGFETTAARTGSALGWDFYGRATERERLSFAGPDGTLAVASPSAFDGADWVRTAATAVAGASVPPGETSAAQTITDDATLSEHQAITAATYELQTSRSYSFGAYLRAETLQHAGILVDGGATKAIAIFDLSDARLTLLFSVGAVVAADVDATTIGDGWIRVVLSISVEAPLNASFGIVLSSDGSEIVYSGAGGDISAWGAFVSVGDLDAIESFDRGWSTEGYATEISFSNSEIASFDTDFESPTPRETFESAWSNRPVYPTLGLRESLTFDDETPSTTEDFEEEWPELAAGSDAPHIISLEQAAFVGALETESFEQGWSSNEDVSATIASSSTAEFDGANAEGVEDFEEVLLDRQVSVDPSFNRFHCAAHGLTTSDVVYFVSVGGTYPGGVFRTIPYWIVNPLAGSFQLSTSQLGSAIDVTSAGDGEHLVRGDPSRYWNTPNFNSIP